MGGKGWYVPQASTQLLAQGAGKESAARGTEHLASQPQALPDTQRGGGSGSDSPQTPEPEAFPPGAVRRRLLQCVGNAALLAFYTGVVTRGLQAGSNAGCTPFTCPQCTAAKRLLCRARRFYQLLPSSLYLESLRSDSAVTGPTPLALVTPGLRSAQAVSCGTIPFPPGLWKTLVLFPRTTAPWF